MKITFVASFFYPHIGGLENYVFNLATRLTKNNQVQVIVCNTENKKRQEIIKGLKIIRLDCWNLLGKRYPIPKPTIKNIKLVKNAFSQKQDVVITNARFYPLTFFAAIIAKFKAKKLIHIEHGSSHPFFENKLHSVIAWIYDNTLGRLSIMLANEVTGSSKAAVDFAKSIGAKGKKTYVSYNGVDTKKFANLPSSQQNTQRILFVGRLVWNKGVHDLVEAFKIVSGEFSSAELILVGDGPEMARLKEQARGLNVKFVGKASHNEVIKFYSQCSIFTLPSYTESAPTTVLEAGAAGLLVIATKIKGITELFDSNDYLFKAGDVHALANLLEKALKNPDQKTVQKFQKKVKENFDWDRLAEDFEKRLF